MQNLELQSTPLTLANLTDKVSDAIKKAGYANRAEALTAIESGQLEYIEFDARVFVLGPNANYLTFSPEDMPAFAESFTGQPHLRNHDQWDIDSRDGTTQASTMNGESMEQRVRLTTRRGMTDFVEGKIDRFSIGWSGDALLCTICNQSWFSAGCSHIPGRDYETASGKKKCMLLTVKPRGKETSSVNTPAVRNGTGILEALQEMKLSINGNPADDKLTKGDQMLRRPQPLFEAPRDQGAPPIASLTAQLQEGLEAMSIIQADAERTREQQEQLALGQQVLIDQCSFLLTAGLQTSRLPEVTQTRLRKQFEGKVFKLSDLQTAIEEARAEVSALTAAAGVTGPGRGHVSGMFGAEEEFRAAVDDMLMAPRDAGMVGKKVRRLAGIREAYILGTGDVDFHGNFDPIAALQFMLAGTSTFPGIVKDSLNKILVKAWDKYGALGYGWWMPLVTIEHFDNLNQVDWLRLGTIGSLPSVAENGDYTELAIGDNVETNDWTKYGGYVALTIEAVLRDDIRAFRMMPDQVALGAMRNISEQFAAIFTSNSAAGPTLADGGALFNSTAVTTVGGHANLLTTALGTDYTAWKAVSNAVYKQPMLVKNASGYYGTGKRQAIRPKYCLVPVDLYDQAADLFVTRQNSQDNKNFENRFYGQVFPIAVPEWTDATDWAAATAKEEAPHLMLGEIFGVRPEIYIAGRETDAAMFANDESRIKVRQFLAAGVADFRGLHKSNVA